MNEQDNVKLVQHLYAAFGRGDKQAILDRLSPDVEWTLEGPAIVPFAGRRVGPAQVEGFFDALATTQRDQKLTIDEYIASGDNVVAIGRYSATVLATGKPMDDALVHVFTIRGGKVVRYLNFTDTARMAEAYTATMAAGR